jgi:uncharacterized protein UPF0158
LKPIPVQWEDLEMAFERNAPDITSFLEVESGAVLTVMDASEASDDRKRRMRASPEAFVEIEPASSREQYRWMERFVATVAEDELKRRLLIAIDGKGAFRRFKDVLLSYPVERERWYAYRGAWLHWHINQWIAARRVVTVPTPWGDVQPPPEPAELLPRLTHSGETLTEALRRRAREAVDVLPAGELPAALSFLEFLRERGAVELTGARARAEARAAVGDAVAVPARDDDADPVTAAAADTAQ